MQRLIDADKTIECMQYYHDDCAKTSEYTRLGFETAIEVVKDAPTVLTIPDNPTNGDVIKAIFPDAKITEYLDLVQVEIIVKGLNLVEIECDINWWNAPYKRGTDESSTDNRID